VTIASTALPIAALAALALATGVQGKRDRGEASSSTDPRSPRVERSEDLIGVVFEDANRNGARDRGERGVPGVVVSDQVQVAVTAADGAFRLRDSQGYGVVFVSVPDGRASVGPFWRAVRGGAAAPIAFALTRQEPPAPAGFTFVHSSDTHVSDSTLPRMRRLRALVDSLSPAFVLVTGDLVRDALRVPEREAAGYYRLFQTEAARFRVPVWTVPGNHEIFGIERQQSGVGRDHPLYGRAMYRHFFGPDYYSFTYGGVHFVGLNTVDYDDQWYYGHVDSTQRAWLERDLALVPPGTAVVTFNHIPLVSAAEELNGYTDAPPAPSLITVGGRTMFRHTVSNAGEVLAQLRAHRYALALGGHMHMRETLVYQTTAGPTRFHQAAAVVADSKAAGMDMASGVTLYRVRSGVVDDGTFVPLGPLPAEPR
jgi:predicted MPP superfamily phosphohydrolase